MNNRVLNEYKQSQTKCAERQKMGILLQPKTANNLNSWVLKLAFQKDSDFYRKNYLISINIPKDYPMSPPYCHFQNKIFHPNISTTGEICLNILKDDWQISFNLFSIAISLVALINTPNCDSPLNLDAGNIYRQKDKFAYQSMINYFYYEKL